MSFSSTDFFDFKNVLCVTPWTPSVLSGGHACIIAVALDSQADVNGLLASTTPFDPPARVNEAQRNLTVSRLRLGAYVFIPEHYSLACEILQILFNFCFGSTSCSTSSKSSGCELGVLYLTPQHHSLKTC